MNKHMIRKFTTIFLTAGLAAVTIYLGLVGTRLVRGVSLTENPPSEVVRLQVLQTGGSGAGLNRLVQRVKALAGADLEVQVVETGVYDLRAVTRTVVVSRTEDLEGAGMLAEQLGLDDDAVWFQPLERNTRQVTAPLILGPDIEDLLSAQEIKKESQQQS